MEWGHHSHYCSLTLPAWAGLHQQDEIWDSQDAELAALSPLGRDEPGRRDEFLFFLLRRAAGLGEGRVCVPPSLSTLKTGKTPSQEGEMGILCVGNTRIFH